MAICGFALGCWATSYSSARSRSADASSITRLTLADFKEEGGFTENMTQERLSAVKENATQQGAPKCPKCGATMRKMMAKKGTNSGHEFWGCTNYPNCNGTVNI